SEVEQVRGGVIGADGVATGRIQRELHIVADADLAAGDAADVEDVAAEGLDAFDEKLPAFVLVGAAALALARDDHAAGVGDLAAHLGVEIGFVENDPDRRGGTALRAVSSVYSIRSTRG